MRPVLGAHYRGEAQKGVFNSSENNCLSQLTGPQASYQINVQLEGHSLQELVHHTFQQRVQRIRNAIRAPRYERILAEMPNKVCRNPTQKPSHFCQLTVPRADLLSERATNVLEMLHTFKAITSPMFCSGGLGTHFS